MNPIILTILHFAGIFNTLLKEVGENVPDYGKKAFGRLKNLPKAFV